LILYERNVIAAFTKAAMLRYQFIGQEEMDEWNEDSIKATAG